METNFLKKKLEIQVVTKESVKPGLLFTFHLFAVFVILEYLVMIRSQESALLDDTLLLLLLSDHLFCCDQDKKLTR